MISVQDKDKKTGVRWLAACVAGLIVLTVGLPTWHYYGMNRALPITTEHGLRLLDDRGLGGTSVGTVWHVNQTITLRCHLTNVYQWPYCGFGVQLSADNEGLDLSRFDTIELGVRTLGEHTIPIKVYLLNFDPAHSTLGDSNSLKINEIQYFPNEGNQNLNLPLNSFHVSPWWLRAHKVSPEKSGTELGRVMAIQIFTGDISQMGDYTLLVSYIVLHGKWLSTVQVLWIVVGLWFFSAMVYLTGTFFRVRRQLHVVRQQKQELEAINGALKLERRELEQIASHDELTGLLNRVGLRGVLLESLPGVHSGQRSLSAVFMDLDHFKQINDTHGHLTGDQVLQHFAQLIRGHTRGRDSLCRWGGEEFILICQDTKLATAAAVAEQLRMLIAQASWPAGLPITCSLGVAEIGRNESFAAFLERADRALYAAKQGGRNRVCSTPLTSA